MQTTFLKKENYKKCNIIGLPHYELLFVKVAALSIKVDKYLQIRYTLSVLIVLVQIRKGT